MPTWLVVLLVAVGWVVAGLVAARWVHVTLTRSAPPPVPAEPQAAWVGRTLLFRGTPYRFDGVRPRDKVRWVRAAVRADGRSVELELICNRSDCVWDADRSSYVLAGRES